LRRSRERVYTDFSVTTTAAATAAAIHTAAVHTTATGADTE
jgi:hypothetical protein